MILTDHAAIVSSAPNVAACAVREGRELIKAIRGTFGDMRRR
jgi:hypothetical protein